MNPFDQSGALRAHQRIRVALPVVTNRIADDIDDDAGMPADVADLTHRKRWEHNTRPKWLPANGERCLIIAGFYAGQQGVAANREGSRRIPMLGIYLDDGRFVTVMIEFVRLVGHRMPPVTMKRRGPPNAAGYRLGDAVRMTGGKRVGQCGWYAGQAGSGTRGQSYYVRLADGPRACVLAKFVERA